MEEEEKNLVETKKRKFFAEILNAVREFHLQNQASLKQRKQRNDGIQVGILLSYSFLFIYLSQNGKSILECGSCDGLALQAELIFIF